MSVVPLMTLVLVAVGQFVWLAPAVAQQPVPMGLEFQVNTYTTNSQDYPAVAADATGNFVVVWEGSGSASELTGIHGQRYDSNGIALGAQFQVNTYTTSFQRFPDVATDGAGNFVVVWTSWESPGSDTDSLSIQGQRYDNNGIALGAQFQVNTFTTGYQSRPAIATNGPGDFVVVWEGSGSASELTGIHGQRYDSNGMAVGAQFQVNTYTTAQQLRPAVASDAAGNFVVAWQSYGGAGTDTANYSIHGRRYDSNGIALGAQFQVNTYTTSFQVEAAVASDGAGNFVVLWTGVGTGSDSNGINGQRYDSNGIAVGAQFQVNTYTTVSQYRAVVAADATGNFVVVWSSGGSAGTDTAGFSVQGQRYDSNGMALGGEFQVNTYATAQQIRPAVASDAAGNFVVAWASYGSAGTDPHQFSIQGQRFAPCSDGDSDGTCDYQDNCPVESNPDQRNSDSDPAGDICDICPTDPMNGCNVNQSASQVIDGTGGNLMTPDGRVALTVPAGAVSQPTTFSVTGGIKNSEFGTGSTAKNLVAVVNLEPEGVTFSQPITLTFAWPDANNNGIVDGTNIREKNLKVYRNGAVIPGTTTCQSQTCTAAACCNMAANTWSVQVTQFSEWAVGSEPCVGVDTAKLILRKVLSPAGDDKLTFIGTLTLPGPGTIEEQLDVLNNGAVVRLVDGDTVVLDVEIPAGAYDTGTGTGWKVNSANTKWIYFAPSAGRPGGIKRLKLFDKSSAVPGLVKFIAKGTAGAYAAGTGVDPALVLPDSARCFEATYPQTYPATPSCLETGGGATIKCQ